jgi:hypothetical protein
MELQWREKKKPKTPLQSTFEEGKDSKSSDKECCGLNNKVIVKSQHQKECKSPPYICHCKHTYK